MDEPIDQVELDGVVAIKVINHCNDNLPEIVTGQLLGLGEENTLQITGCFPFPGTSEEEDVDSSADFQLEMMRCLREVNVDNNMVGWYSSNYLGSFIDEMTIATQFNYQEKLPQCVMLIYDPLKTSQGTLCFKAYRLTSNFMEVYKTQKFTKESLEKYQLNSKHIFEEVPIVLRNSSLVDAFLFELEDSKTMECNFKKLELSSNTYMEKYLEFLCECFDDLSNEQVQQSYYQRNLAKFQNQMAKRKAENASRISRGEDPLPELEPPQEPSRFESLLISNQVENYCKQINSFASNNFTKLFFNSTNWKKDI